MRTLILGLFFSIAAFGQSVTLNWTAAQGNPAGTAYNAYRANSACGTANQTFQKINNTPITALTFNDASVSRGTSYCYRVTSVFGAAESVPSGTAEAVIPLGAPTGLTITVQIAVNVNVNGVEVAQKAVEVTTAGQ